MNFENLTIWHWIIPILIGVLSTFLGYYWGLASKKTMDHDGELKLCQDKVSKLEKDLRDCKETLSTPALKTTVASGTATKATNISTNAFNAGAAKAILGKTIKENDLKVVEGIGPKIEAMFKDAGINTWQKLSDTKVSDCQKILDLGGNRYKIHDPSSWPMQAKMCYEGKWAQLQKWQVEHKSGKL
ncbi:hypothetical protein [Cellulophaga sp. Hel_I_12]|uniref:hypothetical protein n=1 Tax=Cellulophaga sp. Hel_I_12 TaxID=1249972 RepID=UPI0006456B57|nr:hypothetical protein [Cellulophaga sp. Hel_I_12]